MDGVTGMDAMGGCDGPGYRDGRATGRAFGSFDRFVCFIYVRYIDGRKPAKGYVHAPFKGDGTERNGKPREVVERSEAGQTNRNARITRAGDVARAKDGRRNGGTKEIISID